MSDQISTTSKPTVLYKYRTFDPDGHNLRIITHGELWFSSAKSFNDPFDTAITYNFDGIETELAERWARVAVNRQLPYLTPAEKETFVARRLAEIRSAPAFLERASEAFIEMKRQSVGICSLAGSRENLLLWAHYAAQHTGFCVGFSLESLETLKERSVNSDKLLDLLSVKYSTQMPNHNFFQCEMTDGETTSIMDFIATKSNHWSYEQEQRLILWDGVNTNLTVGFNAIQEVILGCKISPANKEALIRLSREHLPNAELLQATKDKRSFSLTFQEVKRTRLAAPVSPK